MTRQSIIAPTQNDMPLGNRRRPDVLRHISSTPHYQSFHVPPPRTPGVPPRQIDGDTSSSQSKNRSRSNSGRSESSSNRASPLPTKQLCVLAVIALAEQTAFNSISPYLPEMTSTFPDISNNGEVGLYVGLIASAFAAAQFVTNFFWGWLSDNIGRKPVILIGTLLTAACFVAFGFCKTLWQAIVVQIFMGLVNGNQGVVSTCLGEITDRSNQSKAFTYLPVVYGIGAVTGPIVGGLLVNRRQVAVLADHWVEPKYPYLPPNLFAAGALLVDLVVTMILMEESLQEAKELPPLGKRVGSLFAWMWQFSSAPRPSYIRPTSSDYHSDEAVSESDVENEHHGGQPPPLLPQKEETNQLRARDVLNRDTFLILATYFVFQLSNIAYNSLYPIFAQAAPPTGRNLSPQEIGISLSFAGLVTIIFQVGIFGKLRDKIGNKSMYRIGLAGFVVSFVLMPWVGYKNGDSGEGPVIGQGKGWLWAELGVVLIVKTLASVGGLTSALLLVSCASTFPLVRSP